MEDQGLTNAAVLMMTLLGSPLAASEASGSFSVALFLACAPSAVTALTGF